MITMIIGAIGFVACAWLVFGWWTIGNPKRRVVGGLVVLVNSFLFSPFLLVKLGEQFGFLGVQTGFTMLFGLLGGAFFFISLGWTGRLRKARKVRTLSEDPDLF